MGNEETITQEEGLEITPPAETLPDEGDESIETMPIEGSKTVPIKRFNQVYGYYKAYKDLGKIEDIQTRLQKLDAYEQAINEQRQKTRDTSNAEDPKQAILKQASEVGLATQADIDKRFEGIIKSNLASASKYFGKLLESNNVKLSPELSDDVEDYLWMKMSQDERDAIMYGNYSILDDIVSKNISTGLLSKWKVVAPTVAPAPPIPPKRHGAGGTPPKPPAAGPKTWKDADDEGWNLLKQKG